MVASQLNPLTAQAASAAKTPVMDFDVGAQSAREASVKSMTDKLSAESPVQPCRPRARACLRLETIDEDVCRRRNSTW